MPTEQEIKVWYNRRYAARGVDSMRTADAYPVFLDDLGVEPGRKLLDVACGTGYLLRAAVGRGLKTWGTDISEEAVRLAQQVSPESSVVVGRGEDLKFSDATFDYVTCIGSLEHFLDMEKGLAEMRRVTKPDALLCILVPNSNFLYWKLAGRHGTEQQDINENLLSFRQWREFFARNGLEVVRTRQDRWPAQKLRPFSSANPLRIAKGLLLKLAWSLLPRHFAYQFVFVLRKTRRD
jgi:SAM-dependent methyltransferase